MCSRPASCSVMSTPPRSVRPSPLRCAATGATTGPAGGPIHNAIEADDGWADFRTVFVCPPDEESEVRSLVNAALTGDHRWTVIGSTGRDLTEQERALAERLATTPRP